MSARPAADALGQAFVDDRAYLWAHCYRLTGSAPDADDLVQATFERALERPPEDLDRPLRPFLLTVATRLGIDRLRHRKSQAYVGPWLPTPIETVGDAWQAPVASSDERYGLLESVSFAFLLALEVLSPKQRAVVLLRDVLDLSVKEAADALDMSEPDVKVSHHRARKLLETYDRERVPPSPALGEATQLALVRFLTALMNDDVEGMAAVMREDVVLRNDGGGEFSAARKPVVGRDRVITFHRNVRRDGVPYAARPTLLNGLPAVLAHYADVPGAPRLAPRFAVLVGVDAEGRIRTIDGVLATGKLAHLAFPELPPAG